jgi:alkylation response protein AidB-like acyl-CoA dehydrogenase
VNGQKSWTTDGHKADWIFALVRTHFDGVKQEGISFILIDMQTQGIEVNPITLINGNQDFCDTFFTDVKVPKENIVGGLHKGWAVAKGLLGHERTMMSQLQEFVPPLPLSLVEYAKEYVGLDDNGKLANPEFRQQLVTHLMNSKAMQLSHGRAFEEGMAGVIDMTSVSYFKAAGTEEDKRGEELRIAMMGSAGLGWEGEGFDQERELNAYRKLLESKVYSLGGGTTEVQLNVVAKKLGLPA